MYGNTILMLMLLDSHLCDPDTPCSCTCCQIQSPPICCKLCHPSSIKEFAQPSVSKPSLAAPRSTVKDYIATPHNMELHHALHSFHTQTCIIKYGQAYFTSHGASIIMSQQVLDCIVDTVHTSKILSKEDLFRETKWLLL